MERERITREELMERLFHDDYENLKGKKLRMTRGEGSLHGAYYQ